MKTKLEQADKKLMKQLYAKLNLHWKNKKKILQANPTICKPQQKLISKSISKKFQSQKKCSFNICMQHEYRKKIIDAIKAKTNQDFQSKYYNTRYKKIQSTTLFQVSNSSKIFSNQVKIKRQNKQSLNKQKFKYQSKQVSKQYIKPADNHRKLYRSNSSLDDRRLFKSRKFFSKSSLKSSSIIPSKDIIQASMQDQEIKGWQNPIQNNDDCLNQQEYGNFRFQTQQ